MMSQSPSRSKCSMTAPPTRPSAPATMIFPPILQPLRKLGLDVTALGPRRDDGDEEDGAVENRLRPERRPQQVQPVEAHRQQQDGDDDAGNVVVARPVGGHAE